MPGDLLALVEGRSVTLPLLDDFLALRIRDGDFMRGHESVDEALRWRYSAI